MEPTVEERLARLEGIVEKLRAMAKTHPMGAVILQMLGLE